MLDHNDHRQIAKRLDLFHLQEEAPGMVFWHPSGWRLYRGLEEAARRQLQRGGYEEVRTPQLLRQPIWEASGHWEHFRENMFVLGDEGAAAAMKPVSCPGHIQIAKHAVPSYRDLPLRLAEFGLCHRNEPSGTLQGLFRLRQFTQDDGHVFCSEEQVVGEVERFCRSMLRFYAAFGFDDVTIAFSSRPEHRAGSDEVWDRAESMLLNAAKSAELEPVDQPGAGAFYGPKLEFALNDRFGRSWQCGTIQLDLVLPERFDVRYVDASGEHRRPVMLHRAMFGSLERFLGVLLEHHGGALPAWLAPEQVVVAPVVDVARKYAEGVVDRLESHGVRVRLDARNESLSKRIAEAHEGGVPFVCVVGKREMEGGLLALRSREGQRELALHAAVEEIHRACEAPV